MRFGKHEFSVKGGPKRQIGNGATAKAVEAVWQEDGLSQEFCDLIYEWDPEAANDEYYVTSADFVQLHAQIKKGLLRGLLWWAFGLCVVMAGITFMYV